MNKITLAAAALMAALSLAPVSAFARGGGGGGMGGGFGGRGGFGGFGGGGFGGLGMGGGGMADHGALGGVWRAEQFWLTEPSRMSGPEGSSKQCRIKHKLPNHQRFFLGTPSARNRRSAPYFLCPVSQNYSALFSWAGTTHPGASTSLRSRSRHSRIRASSSHRMRATTRLRSCPAPPSP